MSCRPARRYSGSSSPCSRGGRSLVFRKGEILGLPGAFGLFAGLLLIAVAVVMELVEAALSAKEIGEEAADLDDPVKARAAGSE